MSNSGRRFRFAHLLNQLLHRLFVVGLLTVSARAVGAQITQVAEGSRVQISTASSKKISGTVKTVEADSTTLFVENGGGTRKFANADVTELRVSRGRKVSEGVKRGVLWGSAVGGALGAVMISSASHDDYFRPNNSEIMTTMLVGGAFWGAVIGAFAKSEQWDDVAMHPRVASFSSGTGVSFSFSTALLH